MSNQSLALSLDKAAFIPIKDSAKDIIGCIYPLVDGQYIPVSTGIAFNHDINEYALVLPLNATVSFIFVDAVVGQPKKTLYSLGVLHRGSLCMLAQMPDGTVVPAFNHDQVAVENCFTAEFQDQIPTFRVGESLLHYTKVTFGARIGKTVYRMSRTIALAKLRIFVRD